MLQPFYILGIPMKTTSLEHGLNGLNGLTLIFSF
jgi:hypothetical protein